MRWIFGIERRSEEVISFFPAHSTCISFNNFVLFVFLCTYPFGGLQSVIFYDLIQIIIYLLTLYTFWFNVDKFRLIYEIIL